MTACTDDGPCLGKINDIFVIDNVIFFNYTPLDSIAFQSQYFGYVVLPDDDNNLILKYDDLSIRTTCILSEKKKFAFTFKTLPINYLQEHHSL